MENGKGQHADECMFLTGPEPFKADKPGADLAADDHAAACGKENRGAFRPAAQPDKYRGKGEKQKKKSRTEHDKEPGCHGAAGGYFQVQFHVGNQPVTIANT